MRLQKPENHRRREGFALAPAMVCIVLVFLICSSLIRQNYSLRGESRTKAFRVQAAWLVESGLVRASAKLAADRKYEGETWQIAAAELGGAYPGIVRIAVKPDDGNVNARQIHVEADYPRSDLVERHRKSEDLTIDLGPENSGGSS